jgi:hypothetical protein
MGRIYGVGGYRVLKQAWGAAVARARTACIDARKSPGLRAGVEGLMWCPCQGNVLFVASPRTCRKPTLSPWLPARSRAPIRFQRRRGSWIGLACSADGLPFNS